MYERIRVNTLQGCEKVLDIYEIDKYGNVYGLDGMNLAQRENSSGYLQVALKVEGERRWKKMFVHRLVAFAFIKNENPNKYNEIDHIDGNKKNNVCYNLRWCDRKGNMQNINTIAKMWLNDPKSIPCYVYDYLLHFVGAYDSLLEAQKDIGMDIKAVNVRVGKYYVLSSRNLETVLKINKKARLTSIVVTDIITHKKYYFPTNREARRFFNNQVNVTQAIQKNWTVWGKYKVRNLNYKKLIGTLDL